jgi:predicted outer membrane repeat protein
VISGCNGTAIVIEVGDPAAGWDANPVVLRNIHITGGTVGQGVAVHIGANTNVKLERCNFTANSATDSIVHALAGSKLLIAHSTFATNTGSVVAFQGNSLDIFGSYFHKNAGANGGSVRVVCGASTAAISGGGNLTCISRISNTTFVGNQAESRGGAVYMTGGNGIVVNNTVFINNTAERAGGEMSLSGISNVDLQRTRFKKNKASTARHQLCVVHVMRNSFSNAQHMASKLSG